MATKYELTFPTKSRLCLACQPQLVDKFNLSKLNGDDVTYLSHFQPQLAEKIGVTILHETNTQKTVIYNPKLGILA